MQTEHRLRLAKIRGPDCLTCGSAGRMFTLAHRTIDVCLADVAALGAQLGEDGVDDWSTVTVVDIEAFITADVSSRKASVDPN